MRKVGEEQLESGKNEWSGKTSFRNDDQMQQCHSYWLAPAVKGRFNAAMPAAPLLKKSEKSFIFTSIKPSDYEKVLKRGYHGWIHMQLASALTLEEQLHRSAPQGKRKILVLDTKDAV